MTDAIAWFDRRAPGYLERGRAGLWGRTRAAEWRALVELLALGPGHEVLDAGCGAGEHSLRIRDAMPGVRLYGVDASPAMLAEYGGRGFEGELARLEDWRTARRFDRVLLAGVLEFVEEPERAVSAVARTLKPGGRIVCLAPAPGPAGFAYRAWHRLAGCPTRALDAGFERGLARACGLRAGPRVRATPISAAFVLEPA